MTRTDRHPTDRPRAKSLPQIETDARNCATYSFRVSAGTSAGMDVIGEKQITDASARYAAQAKSINRANLPHDPFLGPLHDGIFPGVPLIAEHLVREHQLL